MKNVVAFMITDQGLYEKLRDSLPNSVVLQTRKVAGLKRILKSNAVCAVAVHMLKASHSKAFEILNNDFPDILTFFITTSDSEAWNDKTTALAVKYGATVVSLEAKGVEALATLIRDVANSQTDAGSGDKAAYVELLRSLARELERLQSEFIELMVKTLPQPNVPYKLQRRLEKVLAKLQAVRIIPPNSSPETSNSAR